MTKIAECNASPRARIAIIGAGIAGLAAARELSRNDIEVSVFEKNSMPGGRIASHNRGELTFDTGAQNIKSEGAALERAAREVLADGDIMQIEAPVCLHDGRRILPPDAAANAARKWTCRGGMARLCEALAVGLDLRFDTRVGAIRESGDTFSLRGEGGENFGEFAGVICAVPLPQAVTMLSPETEEVSSERLTLLAGVEYTRCIAVLLHVEKRIDAHWYALLARNRFHPLLWLARESAKGDGFAGKGTCLVGQLGPSASRELWVAEDETIVRETVGWIRELLGDDFSCPRHSEVRRWPYAQPVNPLSFDVANPPAARLIVCGDGVSAARVPEAYASGLQAAARFIEGSH